MANHLTKNVFSRPVEETAVRQNWQSRGYSFHLMTDRPKQEWNGFVHPTDELLTVVSGKLKLLLEGSEVICEAGDEVFIPRDCVHSVHNINSSKTTWIFGYN